VCSDGTEGELSKLRSSGHHASQAGLCLFTTRKALLLVQLTSSRVRFTTDGQAVLEVEQRSGRTTHSCNSVRLRVRLV